MAESQNIEWKEVWRDEYLKWICGFANAKGGRLYIGKTDDGSIIGLKDFQRLLEDIPNKITNYLGIVCDVNLLTKSKMHYIEIVVPSYEVPISYHGKYHYRSGSTKQELHGTALNEFLQLKTGKSWDDVIEPNASLNDIDKDAVEAFKRGAAKSKRLTIAKDEDDIIQLFQNLRLSKDEKLKRAAILLFGKDPRNFFINAFVKIGRFGKSDTELLSQEVIEGNIFELADQTMNVLEKKYLKKLISYDGLHRIETLEYPYEAVREMLLNAIVHRQYTGAPIQISIYDEKIMIWNYGVLPESITFEDLKHKHASHPRNPILADIFFKGGLIEAWGRGTLKIIDECKNANLPEPVTEEITGGICVTIFKNRLNDNFIKNLNLTERQIKALEFLKENHKITNKDYQEINNCSRNTASNDLIEMVDKGIFKPSGNKGAGAFYSLK